ncbi:MAG TPA: helix-turn-helix domain-containing protein [Terriglobales bacterium]
MEIPASAAEDTPQSPSTASQEPSATPADPASSENVVCFTLRSARSRAEVQAIRQALGFSGWNRRRAARLLEISYRSLLLKIQQHKITRQTL